MAINIYVIAKLKKLIVENYFGVTLHIYTRHVTSIEEKKIIQSAANKNRINTQNTNDLQQFVTAKSNFDDVVSLVCTMHKNEWMKKNL